MCLVHTLRVVISWSVACLVLMGNPVLFRYEEGENYCLEHSFVNNV